MPSPPPASDPNSLSKRVFVGGLPYNVQKDALFDLFSPFGEILNITLKSNRDTYAFIVSV